jgi:hypothetical protein
VTFVRTLRVLITNNELVHRAGSELYVRDVALGLLERGHSPIAYSTRLGPVADELRRATVPVIGDLDALAIAPDIIHGQHHLETMSAVLRFPDVPAISFCHGWLPWEEMPATFPSVQRYVAVDATCRDRLLLEHGIPLERIDVLYNFVDLDRFKIGPTRPDRPRRALVFSNAAHRDSHVVPIREACDRRGILVDVVGMATRGVDRPELILGDYDLVFAKGRAAMEAMATGCAVILCDLVGAGPLVRPANFSALRELNFGIRTLRDPATADHLGRQIDGYDPAEAGAVRDLLRSRAGRAQALDALLEIYDRAMRAPRAAPALGEVTGAVARYLEHISPRVKNFYEAQGQLAESQATVAMMQGRAAMLGTARDQAIAALDLARRREAALESDLAENRERRAALERQLAGMRWREASLSADLVAAREAEATLRSELGALQARAAALQADLAAARGREGALSAGLAAAREQDALARTDLAAVRARAAELEAQLQDVYCGPTMRLRRAILALPLIGGLARGVVRAVLGEPAGRG